MTESTFNNDDDFIGLEKGSYTKFYTSFNVRRPAQAPIKFDTLESGGNFQLPTGSILHSVNGFDTLVSPDHGLPNPLLPFVTHEKLPVWLKIHSQVAHEDSKPFGVKETYSYRPNLIKAHLSHFYQTHRRFHAIISDRTITTMGSALVWLDYSPLNEITVSGTLHVYRKFDIIFRTILDMISNLGSSKHHYILLPQSNHVFGLSILLRALKDLSTGTLNGFNHDPSIFPIIHLLGYTYGLTRDVSVTPYKEDVKILGKNDPLFETLHSTSLIERLNPNLFSSINFILQKDDKAVVYNLADLANFSQSPGFYQKFYRHVMRLRLSNGTNLDHIDTDSEEFDQYVEDQSGEKVDDKVVGNVQYATRDDLKEGGIPLSDLQTAADRAKQNGEPVFADVHKVVSHEAIPLHSVILPKTFEDRLRQGSNAHSADVIGAEPKKEAKHNALLDNHFKSIINGRSVGELIQPLTDSKIQAKSMEYLTDVPETSYQKSSLLAMDRTYQTHAYHHDMGKVVGSLAKHGMFVGKVEEEKTHTEMDRTTTYKIQLSDLAGKTHFIRYTLPDVDPNGMMKLGGIEYRLTRQIANVPICKITPTRVNLSSYYNKIIIERVASKRYSYENDITKLILSLKAKDLLTTVTGNAPLPTQPVAYDYTAIGRSFTEIYFKGYTFYFAGDHAPVNTLNFEDQDKIKKLQETYGAYVGNWRNESLLFWDTHNQIHLVDNGKLDKTWLSFQAMLIDVIGLEAQMDETPVEWTQANIINQTIPLVFILGYHFGLKTVLDMIRLSYRFYNDKKQVEIGVDDIAVTFADGVLVFNRYPLAKSLIAGGLKWVNLKTFRFNDMILPETYGRVFQLKGMTLGVLKGLNGFYNFFVDPMTETVLEKMGEPITFPDLLLRANVMLTDYASVGSSSVKLHRFRLYERFNGFLYNEIYRGLQTHRNNPSSKKSFSINPEAVFQKIVQDATVAPNDVINPVHEVKQRALFTYTGGGGRMGRSFTPKDLIYPVDAVGVISEGVPDSGKVGINSYLSASPNVDDIQGIPKPYVEGDDLQAPQILSIANMVMPAGTTDDGKRANYLGIQISHYVPNHDDGETLAVRTGYDVVLPHLSSDVFAVSASDDGVVEAIDVKQKVIKVKYVDKAMDFIKPLKLNYTDTVLEVHKQQNTSVGYLVPETEIGHYPQGGVFALSKNVYGKITDRLRCDTTEAIPDKDCARKQNSLIQDFMKGKYKALYYLRFTLMGNTTPGEIKNYSYGDIYSQNSGTYLLQKREPRLKVGDHFKTGDILVYNKGFFVPDPLSNQVTFKHGITTTVALIDKSSNLEDACEISQDLSTRLKMNPSHSRPVVTKSNAVILDIVRVGDHVETSDSLCLISDDYLVGSSMSISPENLDIVEKLNRQSPSAGYTGVIKKIRILYGCEREKLSESLKAILKTYEKEVRDNFKVLNAGTEDKIPDKPGWVSPGTRYQGIVFTDTTVVLEFMIEETLDVFEGDKLCFGLSSKSIVSHVSEKPHYTESGLPVDALFSTVGLINRTVLSPFLIGMSERNLGELKKQVLDLYFDSK